MSLSISLILGGLLSLPSAIMIDTLEFEKFVCMLLNYYLQEQQKYINDSVATSYRIIISSLN